MDDFNDNFADETEVDPAAEFLAREQDDLAGLEDELKPAVAPVVNGGTHLPATESTGSFEMINSLGQNDNSASLDNTAPPPSATVNGQEEAAATSSSSSVPLPSSTSTSSSSTAAAASDQPQAQLDAAIAVSDAAESNDLQPNTVPVVNSSPSKAPTIREEPEKIKKWREDQKKSLEEKDLNEEKKKEELRAAAKIELDEWYRHHEDLIAKTRAANRESAKNAEKQFVAEAGAIEPGTEWERIAKLCDFNPKSTRTSKDVSRMRTIILQLKQNPLPLKTTAKQG